MAACPECGIAVEQHHRYCHACGGALPGTEPRKLFLEDLYHHCARCAQEERYGRLVKCTVCVDHVCGSCTRTCTECGEAACLRCLLDCQECGKTGCARCYDRCESCKSVALCPEHALACEDCGFTTCEKCLRYCDNCDLEVCQLCHEEAHDKKRRVGHG